MIGALSTLVMVPITTYYLDPKDFGILAILSALTMPIGPLASTGVAWVLPANYFIIDEEAKKTLVFNLLVLDFVLKLLWVLIFWLLSPLFLPLLIKDYEVTYELYFKLILISIPITAFWPTISCLIVMQKKGIVHATFEMLQWISGAIITVFCLVIFKLKTITLFLGPLFGGIIFSIVILRYVSKYIKPQLTKQWLIEIVKVGMPSIPANLFEILTNVSDRYFIQRWINLSKLGIYSHSQSYKNVFTMGTKGFTRTFGPISLEVYAQDLKEDRLQDIIHKWYGLISLMGLFITFFSYEFINVITHGKFVEAAILVPIWFCLIIFQTYGFPYTQYLIVQKKSTFLMYSQIITGLTFILATAVLVYWFGIIGATIGIVLSNLAIQLTRKWYARHLGCNSIGEKEFIITIVMLISIYLIINLMHINVLHRIIAFIFISVLVIFYYKLLEEIKKIINHLRQRNP